MLDQSALIRFSLSDMRESERVAGFREVFGRGAANLDTIPQGDELHAEALLRILPGASIMWANNSPMRFEGPFNPSIAGDDLVIVCANSVGAIGGEISGREVEITSRFAEFVSCDQRIVGGTRAAISHLTLKIQRRLLKQLVRDPETMLGRPISTETEAFRYLKRYIALLKDDPPSQNPELNQRIATHFADLFALTIGVDRDTMELVQNRGLRSVRLETAKKMISNNLHDQSLSVSRLAAMQKVTSRYIQMIFEEEGMTFSQYVLEQRLMHAYRLLANSASAAFPIGSIALDSGFGDISYFNQAFRRRFGETPTDVRQRALRRTLG